MFNKFRMVLPWLLLLCAASPALAGVNHKVSVGAVGSGGYGYGSSDILGFFPANLTINAGDTVTFTYAGYIADHDVVSDTAGLFRCANGCDGAGGNGNPSTGWTVTIPFNNAGTFGYHCEMHQSMGMVGTITVNAATPPPPTFAITPGLTGTWYNNTQSGQGFNVEVLANNLIGAFWYVFDDTGHNLFLIGVGNYSGNTATFNVAETTGGFFPPAFDSTKITRPPWGTLSFTFTDCNNGTVTWTPIDTTHFSGGTLAITRLTSVGGLACP
ncbi:plastocyanin/azurin family copper-binding protein [Rudaea sp.]|uniref:plastocyanin/azurin family copper-binding protein n=1 Tax=Rudaea sp. TaxID=2136325 RepID=UPI002F94837A